MCSSARAAVPITAVYLQRHPQQCCHLALRSATQDTAVVDCIIYRVVIHASENGNKFEVKVGVKQYLYRPGEALRVLGV